MSTDPRLTLVDHFAELDDPRMTGKCRHKLLDMLVIAVSGIICQAEDWVTIAELGRVKERWFRTFLELPNGIASHDTFSRVFARIDPDRFATCFSRWMHALREPLGGV